MSKQTSILHVDGMSCSHCENAVKKAVGSLPGVEKVTVDLPGKTVTVEYEDGKVTLREMEDAITDQGYDVQ